jgi:hypothetical protein
MLQVFTILLYQNVFQNPELFGTQVSLSPEQSTLVKAKETKKCHHRQLMSADAVEFGQL